MGHNKLPMAQLKEIASGIQIENIKTYIRSSNLAGTLLYNREAVRNGRKSCLKFCWSI